MSLPKLGVDTGRPYNCRNTCLMSSVWKPPRVQRLDGKGLRPVTVMNFWQTLWVWAKARADYPQKKRAAGRAALHGSSKTPGHRWGVSSIPMIILMAQKGVRVR